MARIIGWSGDILNISEISLRRLLDKLLLKEPLVKPGSGEMRQNLQCLHMSIWARPDAHKWRCPHLSAANIGVRCGEAQRLDTLALYLHFTKYILPPHYLPTLPCHQKMEFPSCR